jgi:hypothetical protein
MALSVSISLPEPVLTVVVSTWKMDELASGDSEPLALTLTQIQPGSKTVNVSLGVLLFHSEGRQKSLLLIRSDTYEIVTNCERGFNGTTEAAGKVTARSRANPVDEKHFNLTYEAVHNEICKDQFKDQMIVVSLSACTYASNNSGHPYQGINGVVRATDKQHIFSNKSDNLYTIQRCDLTKDSLWKTLAVIPTLNSTSCISRMQRPPRGIHIMAVGDDPKSESATLDIRHVVPPGTETASILSVGRGRSGFVPTGADMVVAYTSQSDSNNVTTNAQARVIVFNRDSNPLTPPASGLEQSLSNHTQVTGNAYFNEDMKSRSDLESVQLRKDLKSATISEPESTDATYSSIHVAMARSSA